MLQDRSTPEWIARDKSFKRITRNIFLTMIGFVALLAMWDTYTKANEPVEQITESAE